ncbi:hypothetical protein AALT_g11076 [Alternaria alternata]|nr:hypothetical protein AALT_g11076 [Alternaria alternata]
MSETAMEQSSDSCPYTVLAKWNSWFLVQYLDDDLYDVLKSNDLHHSIRDMGYSNLPSFSPDKDLKYVQQHKYAGIEYMGYISFGSYTIIIFSVEDEDRPVRWLTKSKLTTALGDEKVTVTDLLKDDSKDMRTMRKARHNTHRASSTSETDSLFISDENQGKEQNTARSASEDYERPIKSRETPDPDYPRLRNTSDTHSTRFKNRDMSGSPDANHRSGRTPGPREGGTVVYGRQYGDDLRGFVERDDGTFEIEVLEHCPDHCLSPNSNTTSLGPMADKDFLERHKRDRKLDTSMVKIVGCAAKWHSEDNYMAHIYVLLEIESENKDRGKKLKDLLDDLREKDGEKYSGPIICSYSTFKAHVRTKKEDLQLLAKLLRKSQFAKKAQADHGFDVARKIEEKPARAKKANKAKKETDDNKKQKDRDDRMLDNMQQMLEPILAEIIQRLTKAGL